MRSTIFPLMLAVTVCAPLMAADEGPVELTLHARAIESPPLKYRLLPAERELKAGNAVPILLRLPWEQNHYFNSSAYKTLRQWPTRPLDAPEWKAFPQAFPSIFYEEMKRAAYRRDALWEYPIGEEPAYLILLPDVNGLRFFLGAGVAGKARYHLTRGELDQARECILVGLANARHIAQTPFFVNQLIANAIHQTMLDQTLELMAQPNSPNLYWALSTLPESLLQLNRAASLEADMFAMTLEAANDLDRPREPAEWLTMSAQLEDVLDLDHGRTGDKSDIETDIPIDKARSQLPQLLRLAPDKVATMSDAEVRVRWYVYVRISFDQQVGAALCLPPREAWARLKALQSESDFFRPDASTQGIAPLQVYLAAWSLNRRIQTLRIIEAVRDYLAAHAGTLPTTLADITNVPIPLDPLTDQPFEWTVQDGIATLKAAPLPGDLLPPDSYVLRRSIVELRLRAATK